MYLYETWREDDRAKWKTVSRNGIQNGDLTTHEQDTYRRAWREGCRENWNIVSRNDLQNDDLTTYVHERTRSMETICKVKGDRCSTESRANLTREHSVKWKMGRGSNYLEFGELPLHP